MGVHQIDVKFKFGIKFQIMQVLKDFVSKTMNRIGSFIAQEREYQPILVLLLIVLDIIEKGMLNQTAIFVFFCFVALFTKWNILFALPFWVKANNWTISLLALLISIASCTFKWKLHIFIFVSVVALYKQEQTNGFVVAATSLFLIIQIGKNLVFHKIKENIYYFTGFFTLAVAFACLSLIQTLELSQELPLMILIVIASANLGYQLITQRIVHIKKGMDTLRDPHLLALCLHMLDTKLEDSDFSRVKLKLHREQCNKTLCFCKYQENQNRTDYMRRQMFRNAIDKFRDADSPLLNETYIDHLLEIKQTINALYLLTIWKPRNYFSFLCRLRCEQKIKIFLEDVDSKNPYEDQYQDALEYDALCLKLSTQIYEVLALKVDFWKQLAKEEPKLDLIQKKGIEAVEKMYKLNTFYGQTIKAYEQSLFSFNATALYLTFLTSSTSFKDYTKELMKRTSKRMEEINLQVGQNFQSESFSIQTIIRDMHTSYLVKDENSFKTKNKDKKMATLETQTLINLRMVINQISTGMCTLLKQDKRDMIGKQLNTIIPNGYKEAHSVRMSQLLNFTSQMITQDVYPSKILHSQLQLPIRGANGELHLGYVCIRYHIDIDEGLSFISIIKQVDRKSSSALLDFTGKITEKQEDFPIEVMSHPDTVSYLKMLQDSWEDTRVMSTQNFSIMMEGSVYEVIIGSPLVGRFFDQQNVKRMYPPIHIEVKNNNSGKAKVAGQRQIFKSNHIDNVDKAAMGDRQSSVTSTEKSVSSAVSILSTFSQNNSVPLYRCIAMVFFLILALCLVGNIVMYLRSSLNWDGAVKEGNPILQFMSVYEIVFLGLRSESRLINTNNFYKYQNVLNTTRINDYLSHKSYQKQINDIFQETQHSLKQSLANVFSSSSTILGKQVEAVMETVIPVTNMGTQTVMNPSFYSPILNLAYREIQMLCASDYNHLQYSKNYDMVLVSLFSSQIFHHINSRKAMTLKAPIITSIEESGHSAGIFGIVFTICIAPLVIPLFFILRKRFQLHERVFDLLTSVDVDEIEKEIKVLMYSSNIVSNYLEYSGKLKENILQYEENAIIPHGENTQAIGGNQLILGIGNENQCEGQIIQQRFLAMSGQKVEIQAKTASWKLMSIFKLIRNRIASIWRLELTYKKRKRMGQLDVNGSEYDPQKKLILKHCVLYIMIMLFMISMAGSSAVSSRSTNVANSTITSIASVYQNLMNIHIELNLVSRYIWEGSAGYYANFRRSVAQSLIPNLKMMSQYYTFTGNETNLISACTTTNQTICQLVSSIRIMEAEIQAITKQIVETRYNGQLNNVTTHVLDTQERLFYVQILCNKLYKINTQVKFHFFNEMLSEIQKNDELRLTILQGSIIMAIICGIVGLFIIYEMKKRYLQEVYMLTFLNEAMIIKNKRIESYLDALLKNK